jgi:outer membrane protein OmpA-like peptidoglycan-associated protein
VNQSGLKLLCILVIILSFSATTFAQFPRQEIKPTFDVFGGYSGYNPGGKTNGVDFNHLNRGWSTAATVNFTRRYSLFTEFGSYSNSTVGSARTYLVGPRFTFHRGPFAPFAHIMMGAEHMAPKGQPTNLAFVEAFGGGLDVSLARQFSVRLFQADLVYATGHEPTQLNQNQFFGPRLSAGLIWNIGWKHRPVVTAEKTKKPGPASATTTAEATAATTAEATAATPSEPAASPATAAPSAEPPAAPAPIAEKAAAPINEPAQAETTTPTPEPATKPTEQKAEPTTPSVESPKEEPKPSAPQVASTEKAVDEKTSENNEAAKPAEKPVAEIPTEKPTVTETIVATNPAAKKPAESASKSVTPAPAAPSTVQHVGALAFPYDQYPTLLSPKDKRNLDAVASRLKLEPEATAVIVGSGDRYAPRAAAQRAVNSKDYLVKKGITADRVKVFALPAPPTRSKKPSTKTELIFVPAGATFDPPSSTPVDEQHVKPEHLHVAHPEWHEK